MNKKLLNIIFIISIIILAFFLGKCNRKSGTNTTNKNKKDTTYIHKIDTITIQKDTIIERTKTISIKDTIYIPKDTLIFIESKLYQDSFANIFSQALFAHA